MGKEAERGMEEMDGHRFMCALTKRQEGYWSNFSVVRRAGIEPATPGLKVRCSAD